MSLLSTFPLFPTVPWLAEIDRAICTGNPASFVFPFFRPPLFNLNFLTLNLYDGMTLVYGDKMEKLKDGAEISIETSRKKTEKTISSADK